MRILLFLLCCLPSAAFAQTESFGSDAKNVLYGEAGGIGGYGSINYERSLVQYKRFDLNVRAGFSTYHVKDFTNRFNPDVIFPLAVCVLYGNTSHIELGAGKVLSSVVYFNEEIPGPARRLHTNGNVFIGYRYQKPKGGFMFRITYSPLFTENVRWSWAGVSVGYAF